MILKLAVDQVIRNMVGPYGLRHSSVRIGLPDRAEQPILVHEPAYLFDVHNTYLLEVEIIIPQFP